MLTHLRLYTKRKSNEFYSFWLNDNFVKISLPEYRIVYSDRDITEKEWAEIKKRFESK